MDRSSMMLDSSVTKAREDDSVSLAEQSACIRHLEAANSNATEEGTAATSKGGVRSGAQGRVESSRALTSVLYQVNLVATHKDLSIGTVLVTLADPVLEVLEALFKRHVVDYDSSQGTAVVRAGDGSVALLASCVPELGLHHLRSSGAVDGHRLRVELHTDGGLEIVAEQRAIAGDERC